MNILEGIFLKLIKDGKINIKIKCDNISMLAESESINMLHQIHNIILNYDNNDFECIEDIMQVFKKYNIDCGNCHDF